MYRCLFSYFGGKSKVAHHYPPPQHPLIIEPFAGAASYSLRYCDRDVSLTDADSRIASVWEFLLSDDAIDWVDLIPREVSKGDNVENMLPTGCPSGLLEILRSEANHGTQGAKGVHKLVTSISQKSWHRIVPRLKYWIPKIRHWQFEMKDYRDFPDVTATWFIDPPYTVAGSRYRHAIQDYGELGEWCLSRKGQVIVCEGGGADWLPFVPLCESHPVFSRGRSRSIELVWYKSSA